MKYQIFFYLVLLSACIDEVRLEIETNTEDLLVLDQSIRTKQDRQINGWLVDARLGQEVGVETQDQSLIDQMIPMMDQNIKVPDQAVVIADQHVPMPDQAVVIADQHVPMPDQAVDMNQPMILHCRLDQNACQRLRINEINYVNMVGESRFIEVYHPTNYALLQNQLEVEIQEIIINLNDYTLTRHLPNIVPCLMSSQQFYICDIGLLNSFDHLEFTRNNRDFGDFGDSESQSNYANNTHKILNFRLKYDGFLIESIWHMDETFFDMFNRLAGIIQGFIQVPNQIIPKLDVIDSSLSRCDQANMPFQRLTVSFAQVNPCGN